MTFWNLQLMSANVWCRFANQNVVEKLLSPCTKRDRVDCFEKQLSQKVLQDIYIYIMSQGKW